MTARLRAELAAVATLAAIGGMHFRHAFADPLWIPVVGAAVLATTVSAFVGVSRRVSVGGSCAISLVSLAGFSGVLLFASGPGLPLVGGFVDALRNGVARTFSLPTPLPSDPSLRFVPLGVTWAAAAATAELAIRTKLRVGLLMPATLALLLARVVAGSGVFDTLLDAAAFLAAACVLLWLRSARRLRIGSARPRLAAAAFGLAIVAAPLAAQRLPLVGGRAPYEARDLDRVAARPTETSNPLTGLKASLQIDPPTLLFSVKTSSPSNWQLAVLDTFDGDTWSTHAKYVNAGHRLPQHAEFAVQSEQIRQSFVIARLDDVRLPSAGNAVALTGAPVRFSSASGELLTRASRSQGLRYQVVSRRPRPDQLREALPLSTADGTAVPALPKVPPAIRDFAQDITRRSDSPIRQLLVLRDTLKQYSYSEDVPPGHSYRSIVAFLSEYQRGTAEQFASTFAVVARAMGFPTRVVVGFRPGAPDALGRYVVTSADAHAWAEVGLRGLGWVPFDVTPPRSTESAGTQPPAPGDEISLDDVPAATTTTAPVAGARPGMQSEHRKSSWNLETIGGAIFVTACVALVVIVGLKARRRRVRRHANTAAQRVVGAWEEALDQLRATDVVRPQTFTATELADNVEATVGPTPARHVRAIGTLANVALFSRRSSTEEQAEEAWRHFDSFAVALSTRMPWPKRVRAMLDPRDLSRR